MDGLANSDSERSTNLAGFSFRSLMIRSHGAGRHWLAAGAAVLGPVAIGAVFPHPMTRPVIPVALMLVLAIGLAMTDGLAFALLAAVASMLSVWFFNFPPGLSFHADSTEDVVAIVSMGFITVLTATLVSVLRDRDVRAAITHSEQVETISAMQRALLPERTPTVPGVRIGWHYRTGGSDLTPVGGDWVAIVPHHDISVGVAIGDVAGHGLAAVAAMVEFRYSLRVLAAEGGNPVDVMKRLEDVVLLFGRESFSSCIYGVMHPGERTWEFSNAGHPPPILVRDGEAVALDDADGSVVGMIASVVGRTSSSVDLNPGDVVVLYTDGLVERRDESVMAGIARLQQLARSMQFDDLTSDSQAIVETLTGTRSDDDVAVVLVQYLGFTNGEAEP